MTSFATLLLKFKYLALKKEKGQREVRDPGESMGPERGGTRPLRPCAFPTTLVGDSTAPRFYTANAARVVRRPLTFTGRVKRKTMIADGSLSIPLRSSKSLDPD